MEKIKVPKPIYKKWWFYVVIILAFLIILGATASDDTNPNQNDEELVKPTLVEVIDFSQMSKDDVLSWGESNNIKCLVEQEYSDTIPNGNFIKQSIASGSKIDEGKTIRIAYSMGVEPNFEFKNALKKAKSYSETLHMSKMGIYNQLISSYGEVFPVDAAQYAIDNLDADFKINALEKAKSYSDTLHMSKQGIYDQLTSNHGEQFTAEEAQYAIDNINADWKANALEKAKSYSNTLHMSKQGIYDQLTSNYGEQFTAEEAQYAIDNLS